MHPLMLLLAGLLTLCSTALADAHPGGIRVDPRLVHVTQDDADMLIFVRMPASLAFRTKQDIATALDDIPLPRDSGASHAQALGRVLDDLSVSVNSREAEVVLQTARYHPVDDRPVFLTRTFARRAFAGDSETQRVLGLAPERVSLDLALRVKNASVEQSMSIVWPIGSGSKELDRLLTVTKIYRADDILTFTSFGPIAINAKGKGEGQTILSFLALGAEHIYLGWDHLALIVLVAVSSPGLAYLIRAASAFTAGHLATFSLGVYGWIPTSAFFVSAVELAIALTIAFTALWYLLKRDAPLMWHVMLVIGLIHGFGFSSASAEYFTAEMVGLDTVTSFAVGLELMQLAIYFALALVALVLDRQDSLRVLWRPATVLPIACVAGVWCALRLSTFVGMS